MTEIRYKGLRLFGASIYMPIDTDLDTLEKIQYTMGERLAMSSNARRIYNSKGLKNH